MERCYRRRLRLFRLLALVAACAAWPAAAPSAAGAALAFAPCPDRADVGCATLTVPLDRGGSSPATVGLHVERWTARPARGVLVLLAGGPGQASTSAFDVGSPYWQTVFPGYTLVSFDARGTGRSGRLDCPELDPRLPPAPEPPVAVCARRLGPSRALYGTTDTVGDLDAVRDALGVPQVALAGVSYGTRVALGYAAAYPGRVERLVLDSVVPLTGLHPYASSSLRAIPGAARALCAEPACRRAAGDVGAGIVKLANRIGTSPLRGTVTNAAGGTQQVELWGTDLISLVIRADSEPGVRAELPAAMGAALAGRPRALLRLWHLLRATEPPPQPELFSQAAQLAALCRDGSFPWAPGASPAERESALAAAIQVLPPGATGRFGRWAASFGPASYCVPWPEAGPQAPPAALPDVPVLALAGDGDMRTPAADARALVAGLPRARLLLARGVGHAVLFSSSAACATAAIGVWLNGGRPRAECPRPAGLAGTVPRPPATFSALGRGRGPAARVRRTLAAVRATLAEVRAAYRIGLVQSRWGAFPVAIPGVLGGRLALTGSASGVELTRYAFAPGVSVSGGLAAVGELRAGRLAGAVRVCGPDAARGVLSVDAGGRVRGTLAGRRVGAGGALPPVPPCA